MPRDTYAINLYTRMATFKNRIQQKFVLNDFYNILERYARNKGATASDLQEFCKNLNSTQKKDLLALVEVEAIKPAWDAFKANTLGNVI